jgi:hypothetical protein
MDLQEIISRGRFIFSGALKRLEVFAAVNGLRSVKEIAKKCGKSYNSTLNDLRKIREVGLLQIKLNAEGEIVKKDGGAVYEKIPLVKQIPLAYFRDSGKVYNKSQPTQKIQMKKAGGRSSMSSIAVPSENEILDICKHGEDQCYEFKAPGTETDKLAKEVCAFLNTKLGGIIFYGVDDEGNILGTDKTRQKLDQSLQNSIKNSIAPAAVVKLIDKEILGNKIILIVAPPWNRKDVYQCRERVLIRKGTNVFGVTPEELKKLHHGEYVI